ncbi:MAG: hypothetical protein O7C75_07855 [Verrucomicrobia bacterium]|nr:hypothetical protein [Verrucomicrobiota bacterium]
MPVDFTSVNWEGLKDDPEFAIQLDDIMANRMIQKINYIDWKREITEIVQLIKAELAN